MPNRRDRGESQPEARGVVRGNQVLSSPTLREECQGSLMQGRGSEAGCKPSSRDQGGPAQLRWEALSWGHRSISPLERSSGGGRVRRSKSGSWFHFPSQAAAPGAGRQSEAVKRVSGAREGADDPV